MQPLCTSLLNSDGFSVVCKPLIWFLNVKFLLKLSSNLLGYVQKMSCKDSNFPCKPAAFVTFVGKKRSGMGKDFNLPRMFYWLVSIYQLN